MNTDTGEGPDRETGVKLRERLLGEIPEITVDTSSVYRRGRHLRTRRRLAVSTGALASIALVGVIAWTAAVRPLAPLPPAGTGDSDSGPQASQTTPSPTAEETPSVTDGPSDNRTDGAVPSTDSNEDVLLTPNLAAASIEEFAAENGLTIEYNYGERNMIDAGLAAEDGYMLLITVTAAPTDQTANALESAIAERGYQQVEVSGLPVFRQDQGNPGAPIHWLLIAGADRTEFISIQANPAGTEADGNQISATTVSLVEEELLPFLITASAS